ncbi:MAG: helicase, partial [Hyphomicrobium sp.]
KQGAAAISAKRPRMDAGEARDLAERAVHFKREKGRLPVITSADAWEKRLAEGVVAYKAFRTKGAYEEKADA